MHVVMHYKNSIRNKIARYNLTASIYAQINSLYLLEALRARTIKVSYQ